MRSTELFGAELLLEVRSTDEVLPGALLTLPELRELRVGVSTLPEVLSGAEFREDSTRLWGVAALSETLEFAPEEDLFADREDCVLRLEYCREPELLFLAGLATRAGRLFQWVV